MDKGLIQYTILLLYIESIVTNLLEYVKNIERLKIPCTIIKIMMSLFLSTLTLYCKTGYILTGPLNLSNPLIIE